MFALINAYHQGLLKPKYWLKNISAGLVVGIVALPLAMAFAIASGAKPEQGIITAIVAAIIVALCGGSSVQIAGPTGAFIVVLASITAQYGFVGLQIATLLAGLLLILMGVMRLGRVIQFIPEAVVVGFTAGIGVIIFVTQWKDLLGLPVSIRLDASFYHKLTTLLLALPQFNMNTALLASLSLFLTIYASRFIKAIPSPLIAMLSATLLQTLFHFQGVATIGSVFGIIPNQHPVFHWLNFSSVSLSQLILPAFSIALLGAIESLLSATAADKMTNTKHHSNQELIGQGLANIVAPLFGGFAATGAIARTATNIKHGGNNPLAAIVHSIFLLFVILYLSPLAAYVPLCSLAAILTVVAFHMSDVKHFARLARSLKLQDSLVLWVTFTFTIFSNLIMGVIFGVLVSFLLKTQPNYERETNFK